MSFKMKHTMIHLLLWLIVGILLALIFFSKDTITNWGDNRTKTLLVASLFFFGYTGDAILYFIFRKRKNKIVKDERDDYVSSKATSSGFIFTIIYVFIIAISLYTKYESAGSVPIAWVWFIAYSLVVIANLSTSSFSLIYYYKSGK